MVGFSVFLVLVIALCCGLYFSMVMDEREEAATGTPFAEGEVRFPAFARTRDKGGSLCKEIVLLLRKRDDLGKIWKQGALMRGSTVIGAADRWFQAVCRKKNVYAAALLAALCRLCPEELPEDEADFWHGGVLRLLDTGEGYFLLGLSSLYLYVSFCAHDETVAREAWRQAVEPFRRSAATGHDDGMEAACLLARIGHDIPFTPPAPLPDPLPACGEGEDRHSESLYWRYRLAASGPIAANVLGMQYLLREMPDVYWRWSLTKNGPTAAHVLGMQYLLQKKPDMARAERWLRKAVECGDYQAAHALFENYRNGNFPDEKGRNAAIYLICFICQKGLLDSGLLITRVDVEAKAAKMPLGNDMRSQLAAHWTEGMDFHKRLLTAARRKFAAAEERLARCYAKAGEKVIRLGRQAEARLPDCPADGHADIAPPPREETPQGGQAEERLRRWAAAGYADTAPTPRETAPQGGKAPRPSAPAHKDRPRRSFARPDKR